jgi:putative peptidoglycan lipid II flippase
MSEAHGEHGSDDARREALREQLHAGLGQIAFPVVPSAVAFVLLGDVICSALFQTGKFGAEETRWTWAILAGSAVGLLAQTLGRLYSSTWYALRDTKTPLRFAVVRVTLTALLGIACALFVPQWLGVDRRWGALGLTASAGVAGWVEFVLLRRSLRPRIGDVALGGAVQLKLWLSALGAAGVALGVRQSLQLLPHFFSRPWPRAALVLGAFGVVYLSLTLALRVPEAQAALARVRRVVRFRRG